MSLVVLLAIQFAGWIAFNRITPFTTSRTTIAMYVTTVSALLMVTYRALYEPPLVNPADLLAFAVLNSLLALGISFVHFTKWESARAR